MSRLPPTRVLRAATAVRTGLQRLTARMVPPAVGVLELASGFMATQALYAAAKLGIADVLSGGPRSAEDVAAQVGSNPDATHRLLRACASYGVFSEGKDGRFALTPLGGALQDDGPNSIRAVVLMLGDPNYQLPWGQLVRTVQTGSPAAEAVFGKPLWEFLDEDPRFGDIFNAAMSRLSDLDWPTIDAAYDFGRFGTVVDIGGGQGQLLARVLAAAPEARGILFERASLVADAEEHFRRAGLAARCRVEAGSFFETAPSGGDLYVLKRVIHDLDDEQAANVLATIRRAMSPGATLLVIESVLPSGNTPHFGKLLDLDMMIFVGGRERSEQQFSALLGRAGFQLTRVIPTIGTLSLIEAAPQGVS